jgi:hypothetical protein
MAVANGFGKVVTSGSVFMYDTGDTVNSYKGEPTVNLINPNIVNIYSWWTRNIASIVQLSETYKGQPIYRVSISIDNGDMLYHITERWGAGSGWYMPYVTFNINTPYIASVIYRPVSHPDTRIYGHPSNIGGWGATVDGNIDIDTQWKMHRIDRNFGATVGDNRFYHMHTPSAQIGQTIVVDITNSQIEQKSHVTPFINGTRSATQGLLPIVGNSTIDLSNMSYDSNAQMTFDGTDDGIIISDSQYNKTNGQPLTVEVVMKAGRTGGQYQDIIVNRSDWEYNWMLYQHANDGSIQLHGADQYKSTYIPPTNQYIHVVATVTAGQVYTLYVNGVVQQTITGYSYAGMAPGLLCIGVFGTSRYEPYLGRIDVSKVYNRALSVGEVNQNYNKYKSRFNLS